MANFTLTIKHLLFYFVLYRNGQQSSLIFMWMRSQTLPHRIARDWSLNDAGLNSERTPNVSSSQFQSIKLNSQMVQKLLFQFQEAITTSPGAKANQQSREERPKETYHKMQQHHQLHMRRILGTITFQLVFILMFLFGSVIKVFFGSSNLRTTSQFRFCVCVRQVFMYFFSPFVCSPK